MTVPVVTREGDRLVLATPIDLKDEVKKLPGRRWDKGRKRWHVPATQETVLEVRQRLGTVRVDEPTLDLMQRAASAVEARPLRFADDLPPIPNVPPHPMNPEGGGWLQQRRGYWFALHQEGSVLCIDMGGGKSLVAVKLYEAWGVDLVVELCPSKARKVWPREFHKWGERDWIVDNGSFRKRDGSLKKNVPLAMRVERMREHITQGQRENRPVCLVINYEAAWQGAMRDFLLSLSPDVLGMDECHPAGTMVSTPLGDRSIETLRPGDEVWSVNHETGEVVKARVRHSFARETRQGLIQVGRTRMTPEHPVWTAERGYVAASTLNKDTVCCIESNAQDKTPRIDLRVVQPDLSGRQTNSAVLRTFVCGQGEMDAYDAEGSCTTVACGQGTTRGESQARCSLALRLQSLQASKEPQEGSDHVAGERFPATKWWQRAKDFFASATACIASWLADRGCGYNGRWLASPSLQVRHSGSNAPNSSRGRRDFTSHSEGAKSGPSQGSMGEESRLDSPSIHQQGSAGSARGDSGRDSQNRASLTVYNIETDFGNYFAGGLLVHNCHKLKSAGGKWSKFGAEMRKRAPRRLGKTGTFIPHSEPDVYGECRALDPGIFGTNFSHFKQRYFEMGGFEDKEVVGFLSDAAEREFNERWQRIAYICDENELELPGAMDMPPVTCQLGPDAARAYKEISDDFITWVQGGGDEDEPVTAVNALARILRQQQVTSGYLPVDGPDAVEVVSLGEEKKKLLRDWLEDLPEGEPAVVYARFTEDLRRIREVAEEMGLRYAEISGQRDDGLIENPDDPSADGTMNPDCDIVGAQIQAAAEGIDLTRSCYGYFYSLIIDLGLYKQVRKRQDRPGQTRPMRFGFGVAEGTVDEIIIAALESRENVVSACIRAAKEMGRLEVDDEVYA